MPEIIVKYKHQKTLDALKDLAKYLDYEIESTDLSAKKEKQIPFNGISVIPADSSIDTNELTEIFTGKNINPTELRNEAWRRQK